MGDKQGETRCFATTNEKVASGSPLVGWARMRDIVSVLAAGDCRSDVADDYGLTSQDVALVVDAARMDWIDSSFRGAICLLMNAASAELDGIVPEINA